MRIVAGIDPPNTDCRGKFPMNLTASGPLLGGKDDAGSLQNVMNAIDDFGVTHMQWVSWAKAPYTWQQILDTLEAQSWHVYQDGKVSCQLGLPVERSAVLRISPEWQRRLRRP
jgi:hypothetical protein